MAPSVIAASQRQFFESPPLVWFVVVVGFYAGSWSLSVVAQQEENERPQAEEAAAEDDPPRLGDTDAPADDVGDGGDDGGVSLPTDRVKERQLDRVRRLIGDERWSDSATLVDEILGGDRDFFFRPPGSESTWRSIKTETNRLLGTLPAAGRTAYELQFRARADRRLEEAIEAGDSVAVVEVARRWFHTPAGRRATMLAALEALESGRPLEAASWLERLAGAAGREEYEPTLPVMRAVAWWRAGEREAAIAILERARAAGIAAMRVGGRETPLNYPAGGAVAWLEGLAGAPASGAGRRASEWWLHRGDAARNALVAASRPLLVPRYRVPLTRHPEEARLLERRRKLFADRDMPLLPAGTPLAVDGLLLTHTPMGLLAVDFETGKRVWLQTGGAAGSFFDATPASAEGDESGDAEARAAIRGVFDDATSGTLSSNGALVFAVESDPASLAGPAVNNLNGMFRVLPPAPAGFNALSAYRLANRGELAWRLPAAEPASPPVQPPTFPGNASPPGGWYLGAPLPIGDQLFVLVEERGEIRLDVLAAADGTLLWSQPLAELEEERGIGNRESHLRRVGGLSPSFGDGVLVCPTGAGTTVAVDLATRTLLWAYTYPQPAGGDTMLLQNGVRIRRGNALGGGVVINGQMLGAGSGPSATTGWRDGVPVVAGGRIILTPRESEEIHCVDLRTGSIAWKQPRKEGLYVAGVVDGGVIIVGRRGVQSLGLLDGAPRWATPLILSGACPSGRGVITEGRLFLPLDSPEVIEINLGDGTVLDRSPSRGGAVAGNLVAYRGEVVSQGVDSLDVFHQTSALQERIDTAARQGSADPRMLLWKGQMAIDRGAVAEGIAAIASAHAAAPDAIPDSVVGDALLAALERDFAAAVGFWNARLATNSRSAPERSMLRLIVDGHLRSGDVAAAWATFCRCLDVAPTGAAGQDAALVTDGADPLVSVSEGRWVQGRLRQFMSSASPALRKEIDYFVAERIAAAEALLPVPERVERLTALTDWFAGHPAGKRASEDLVKALGEMITITGATTDAGRDLAVRRDLLLPGLRSAPGPAVEATGGGAKEKPVAVARGTADPSGAVDAAWPFGRVLERRGGAGRGGNDDGGRMTRVMPIPVGAGEASAFPGLHLGYDMQQPGLLATDSYGRRIGEPFGFDVPGRFDGWAGFQAIGAEASTVGRIVVIRSGPLVAGFELTATPGLKHRRLWLLNDTSGAVNEIPMPFLGRGMGGRIGRLGNVPLGLRISEPEEAVPVMAVQGGHARVRGVPVLVNTSLELHDPITGRLLWERHRLPAAGEIIGDEEYVCVVPANGRESAVVSMVDGRMVRVCELPRRDRRLVTCGRRIVVLAEADAAAGPGGVLSGRPEGGLQPATLVLVDPVAMTSVAMGTFAPEARATWAGPGALAVVEPSGTLTVLDLVTGAVRFRTMLPEMPRGMEQVRVSSWEDRLLVFVARQETAEERKLMEKVGMITNLPQQASSRDVSQPATGTLWAVGTTDGAILWPVPATVLRHCLDPDQPESLPVLLFARQIAPARGGERTRLGILCIDKRTGQALCVDDKIAAQQHMLFGCDMVGDPAAHTVTVGRGAAEGGDVVLEFTGQPTAPRPPFQAAGRQPASRDILAELEYWFEKALLLPLPL